MLGPYKDSMTATGKSAYTLATGLRFQPKTNATQEKREEQELW
jgi:hypothetical protein